MAATYADVRTWSDLYPATIKNARVTATGENWKQVEVLHKIEGLVPNTLILISPTQIGLEESKHRYDASFLNDFQPAPGGWTHYEITSYICLKGIYRLLKPFLAGYVRRQSLKQMQNYVLRPVKIYVESHPGQV